MIGTAVGLGNAATIALAIVLAFFFGYSLTMVPLVRAGLTLAVALPLAFTADTFSIAVMEIVDNGVMLAVPGAMDASLANPLFWGALALALAVAYVFAFPVNRHLIARGLGHAVVHEYHGGHRAAAADGAGTGIGSPRKLVVVGLAAMAVTIGVASGGALLLESGGEHAEEGGAASTTDGGHGDMGGGTAGAELSGLAVAERGYALDVANVTLGAARQTSFRFTVVDEHGEAVRDMDEEGGVRMHLIVVRRDLTGYQHLHPRLLPDGSWRSELTLRDAGVYRAFADFERGGDKVVLGTDLFVPGKFAPARTPVAARLAEVDGYRVELTARPRAGVEDTISYRIRRRGRPVDVEPYLGAAGHLVALREGDLGYLHVHPLAERSGEVRFGATFPTAGSYRLFLQFKNAGRVHTVPLTVDVARGK